MPHDETTGSHRWEPGSLLTRELDQILTDALADVWHESWRRDQTNQERVRIFRRRVETQLYFATGQDLEIRYRNERG